MKKMTFALACASTAVLFADQTFNSIGFEDYTLTGDPLSFTGLSGKTDAGVSGSATDSFWLYDGGTSGAADGSAVKKYGTPNLAAPTTGDAAGDNYLELSTEGGTLWRSINGLSSATALGEAKAVPADTGIYIDTMVQFTPTEDGGDPTLDPADKIAIWLDVDSTAATPVTNLMVRARTQLYASDSMSQGDAANFVLTAASGSLNIEAGTWHRLTIEAIQNVFSSYDPEDPLLIAGFKIKVDGVELKSAGDNPFSSALIAWMSELEGAVSPSMLADISAGKVFPSLVETPESLAGVTIQGLGFKGSGAIDNVQFTDYDPNPKEEGGIDFTITAAEGMEKVEWSTDGETWTVYAAATAKAEAGTIKIRLTNADGAVKIVEKTLSSTDKAFDVSDATFGWPEYLGAADASGAYVIDDEAELNTFAAKMETSTVFDTADTTFKLGASFALTAKWAGIGTYNSATDCFKGTFDGQGNKISNVVMKDNGEKNNNYRGFFNQIDGGTVKNLTIETAGFGTTDLPSGEYGCAAIAGAAYNATIENCVAEGTISSGTHNVGGVVIRIKDTTVKGCTNKVNITGSYTKLAGVVVLCQNSTTACLIENCVNEGTITAVGVDSVKTSDGKDFKAGSDGIAGIIAYTGDEKLTIKDCENKGTLVKGTNANKNARIGQMVAFLSKKLAGVQGTNKVLASVPAVDGCGSNKPNGLAFTTGTEGTVTLIADPDDLSSAILMAKTYPYALADKAATVTFDESVTKPTVTVPKGYNVAKTTNGNLVTYSVNQTPIAYTITYKKGSETLSGLEPAGYTVESAKITLPTYTDGDYKYTWCVDSTLLTNATQIAAGSTGNKTYYAKQGAALVALTEVTLSSATVEYGTSTAPTATVKAGETTVAAANYDLGYSKEAPWAVGDVVTVTATAKGTDYKGTATATFTVVAKSVTPEVTLSAETAEFSAELALPTVTVAGDYVKDTDYTVTWDKALPTENPTENVVLTVTVAMKGNYTGSATKTFTVTPKKAAYPTYIGDDAAKQAKYEAWAKVNGADTESAYEAAYLLNVAPTEAEAEAAAFKIVSISIDAEGNVTVIAPAKNTKKADFNGTVEVKGCATVDGEYTLDVGAPTARFFKAFLK